MAFLGLLAFGFLLVANAQKAADSTKVPAVNDTTVTVGNDSLSADSAMALIDADLAGTDDVEEGGGLHKQLKRKFLEGSAGFMSLVALALVLGLAFCIERIVYLTLSEVNTKKLMAAVDSKLEKNDVEGAKDICRDTRGPVASICYQALLHIKEPLEQIDRQLTNYGTVQIAKMADSDSWRYQSNYCGQGYEGGSDNNDIRYRGGYRAAVLL